MYIPIMYFLNLQETTTTIIKLLVKEYLKDHGEYKLAKVFYYQQLHSIKRRAILCDDHEHHVDNFINFLLIVIFIYRGVHIHSIYRRRLNSFFLYLKLFFWW